MMVTTIFMVLPSSVSAKTYVSATGEVIDQDDYWGKSFYASEGVEIQVSIDSDVAVDILLMDYNDFGEYQAVVDGDRDTFQYYVTGSKFSVTQFEYTFIIPQDGQYYIVIDNTEVPDDGSYAWEMAAVTISVIAETDEGNGDDSTPGFEVVGLIVSLSIAVALATNKKRR